MRNLREKASQVEKWGVGISEEPQRKIGLLALDSETRAQANGAQEISGYPGERKVRRIAFPEDRSSGVTLSRG